MKVFLFLNDAMLLVHSFLFVHTRYGYTLQEGGLLCTTYGMFSKVEGSMLGVDVETWDYIFMDEGHRAKNKEAG